jgi:hypothetical protein
MCTRNVIQRDCGHWTESVEKNARTIDCIIESNFYSDLSVEAMIQNEQREREIDGPVTCLFEGSNGSDNFGPGQSAARRATSTHHAGHYVIAIFIRARRFRCVDLWLSRFQRLMERSRTTGWCRRCTSDPDEEHYYVVVRESGGRLFLFDDGTVSEWTEERERLWRTPLTTRMALCECSDSPSLFRSENLFAFEEVPAGERETPQSSKTRLHCKSDAAKGRRVGAQPPFRSSSRRADWKRCDRCWSRWRQTSRSLLSCTRSISPKCRLSCDVYMGMEKNLIVTPPIEATRFLAATATYILAGVMSALKSEDKDAIAIAMALFHVSSMLLWRPEGNPSKNEFHSNEEIKSICSHFRCPGRRWARYECCTRRRTC